MTSERASTLRKDSFATALTMVGPLIFAGMTMLPPFGLLKSKLFKPSYFESVKVCISAGAAATETQMRDFQKMLPVGFIRAIWV